jgi:hypothetical protein
VPLADTLEVIAERKKIKVYMAWLACFLEKVLRLTSLSIVQTMGILSEVAIILETCPPPSNSIHFNQTILK